VKYFLIETRAAQAIADYLTTKPYREVAGLISILEQLRPSEPDPAFREQDQAEAGDKS